MTPAKLLLLLLVLPGAQFASAQTSVPAFEVATIKPTGPSSDGHTHINYPPGDRFSTSNITVLALMQWAYGMPEKQILDGRRAGYACCRSTATMQLTVPSG